MRLPSILSSSAVLAALCTMLMGGCGGSTSEQEDSNATLSGDELNGGPTAEDSSGKITICHVPPGNPANAHTLVVGASAWKGHSRHPGDHLGACEGQGEPDAGVPPASGDGPEAEAFAAIAAKLLQALETPVH